MTESPLDPLTPLPLLHGCPLSSGTDAYTCRVLPVKMATSSDSRHEKSRAPGDARHTSGHQPRSPAPCRVDTPSSLLAPPTRVNRSAHRPKHRWPYPWEPKHADRCSRKARVGSGWRWLWFWEGGFRTAVGVVSSWPRLLCWLACVRFAYSLNPG